ncbi:MAG: Na+/H+ antiporter [Actinomycetota bacterium]|nr:Na+/H+ antiporter [Actinomycetota bacterium]
MNDIEVLIVLVAVAAVLVRLADLIAIPFPIVLVLGGIGIGALPGGPVVELDPEVIFLVFLPPLLQSAGYYASPHELRAELVPLTALVIGLTLATMVAVAYVAQAVVPGIGWPEALVLGAIVAPTDPVAAIATFGRVGVSDRVALLVEGESMLNDAAALVAYRVALTAVLTGAFSAGEAAIELVVAVAGGIAIGFAICWGALQAIRRLDDPPLSILISVLTAYVSFALAEEVEASGVLAVVTAGLYLGWHSHDAFDADLRLSAQAFWRVLVFALNAILFILLGLQFPDVIDRIDDQLSIGELIGYGVAVSAVVIVLRIAWQFLPVGLGRIVPALGNADTGADWRERLLVGWSGMRGAVSLAAALALPLTLDSGEPFADRDLIIYLTVAVILATLVIQGLTLPSIVRVLGLASTRPWAPDEAIARLESAQAALDRLDELEAQREGLPEESLERLRDLYRARFARCVAVLQGGDGGQPIEDPAKVSRKLRRELIGAERETLLKLRNERRIKGDIVRRIQRDLDLDEARLRQ